MATGLREGTVLDGKYRIDRRLAEGGMGVVFVAEHLFLKKAVALKVLHADMSQQAEAVERFTVEARAASLIDHENVVRISDFGRSEGQLYLVMELLDGHDLADELAREGQLSTTRARFIAARVLRGLEAAHQRGVIHRDLKPENVFISERPGADDAIKLLDFGIARMRPDPDSNLRLTKDGAIMGTPFYMAPEQLRGQRDVDARSDLYAVGVILYEMVAGTPPYTGGTFSEIAHAILEGKPRPLVDFVPAVDAVLSAVVMKAFTTAREARFQTAGELYAALERHGVGQPLAESPYLKPRISQLSGISGPDSPTVRERGGPMTLAATIDRALDRETPQPAATDPPSLPPTTPSTPPALVPADEPALELDRPSPSPPEPPAPPRRSLQLMALLVLLGAGAAGALFLLSRPPAPQPPVTVQVRDLPRGARVFLDGVPSSAHFMLPGDGRQHRIRLQASGYTDKGLLFVADGDQTLDGEMTPKR